MEGGASVANKSLWTLVSGPSLHTERDVIRSELEAQADSLFEVGVEFTMIRGVSKKTRHCRVPRYFINGVSQECRVFIETPVMYAGGYL